MDFDAILIIVNTVTAHTVKNEGENTLSVPKLFRKLLLIPHYIKQSISLILG